MILELAGLPGVGKFTIGRVLAEALGARLVDNNTIANPAFVSTSFGSPEFHDMVRSVRKLTFSQLAKLPPKTSIVLTTAPSRSLLRFIICYFLSECWSPIFFTLTFSTVSANSK